MKSYSHYVGLTIAVACGICLADLASAQAVPAQRSGGLAVTKSFGFGTVSGATGQNDDDEGGYSRSGPQSQQRTSSSASASRSVSFSKDGMRVSIAENAAGITVSVNGHSVRAKNVAELEKRFPDAYRLYEEGMSKARTSARASAGGSARAGGGGGAGLPGQFQTHTSQDRSISVIEDGKTVSITENEKGITVSVNGKRVRAKNEAELKKNFPDAFDLYEKHSKAPITPNGQPDATALLRGELGKLRDDEANPQLKSLIETMLKSVAP
ncbi:MAG: hypothetical protein KDB14_15355 [Planctomycetales bacterium]|nr:hypothetical protein [Planctomycetales bacterium]